MADHSFPQHGDEPDAANFAGHVGFDHLSSYIVGLSITVDTSNVNFDTSEAVAWSFIETFDTTSPDISPAETRRKVLVKHELDVRTDISLTDQETNYVYLQPQLGINDSPQYVVNTTDTAPDSDSYKVAEISIDSTIPNSSLQRFNRLPDARAESLVVGAEDGSKEDYAIRIIADTNLANDQPRIVFEDHLGEESYIEGGLADVIFNLGVNTDEYRFRTDGNTDIVTIYDHGNLAVHNGSILLRDSNGIGVGEVIDRHVEEGTSTLSGGSADIDLNETNQSAVYLPPALGVADGSDAQVTGHVGWDSGTGTHHLYIEEVNTTVDSFDVNWRVIRSGTV